MIAGGCPRATSKSVEIFKPDTSQRYRTVPNPNVDMSLIAIGNTCYALGGFRFPSKLNEMLYAFIDDLVSNSAPASQTTLSGISDTQLIWKSLPNTPTYGPAAAMLTGNILAMGGKEIADKWGSGGKKEVYMYSPSINSSWIYIYTCSTI